MTSETVKMTENLMQDLNRMNFYNHIYVKKEKGSEEFYLTGVDLENDQSGDYTITAISSDREPYKIKMAENTRFEIRTKLQRGVLMPEDIVYTIGGYEQTNIDFYVVVKRTAKTTVCKKMKTISVSDSTLTGLCVPDLISNPEEKEFRGYIWKSDESDEENTKINGINAYRWNGRSMRFSTYA